MRNRGNVFTTTAPSGVPNPIDYRIEYVRREIGGNACWSSVYYDAINDHIYACVNPTYWDRDCDDWNMTNWSGNKKAALVSFFETNTQAWGDL